VKGRCAPEDVREIHRTAGSWRKAAGILNRAYGVNLSHLTWRDYATGRRDIADLRVRDLLKLPPRICPRCGQVILPGSSRRRAAEQSH
jgi:hypothetical protein